MDVVDEGPEGLDRMESAFPFRADGVEIGVVPSFDPRRGRFKQCGGEFLGEKAFAHAVGPSKEQRVGQTSLLERLPQVSFGCLVP